MGTSFLLKTLWMMKSYCPDAIDSGTNRLTSLAMVYLLLRVSASVDIGKLTLPFSVSDHEIIIYDKELISSSYNDA